MQDKKNLNLVIVGAIVLVVGVACYFYVTRDRSSADSLLTGELAGSAVSVDGDLISALSSLRRLRLDDTIFSNPVWLSLTDFGQILAPQASGRSNPFAPLEGAASAAASVR